MSQTENVLILGASGGIGFACAELFHEAGYSCALHAFRNRQKLQDWAAEQENCFVLTGDLKDPSQVTRLISQCEYHVGKISHIVYCAGIAQSKPFTELTDDDYMSMYDIHVLGAVRVIRAAFDHLVETRGSIVLFSSMWGQVGASCESHYAASKGAVLSLTKSLAKEFAPYNIRVNCVSPGLIDTPMNDSYTSEDLADIIEHTPISRQGSAMEAAVCARFLCSKDASFINGQILSPNGGYIL